MSRKVNWDADEDYPDRADLDADYGPDEPLSRAFCDIYVVHGPHAYRALDRQHYDCPGLTDVELAYDPGTCEHGMRADLCAGPGHYPPDGPD